MFHICTYCVFALWGRTDNNVHQFITFTYSLWYLFESCDTKCVFITLTPTYHPHHYMIVGMTEMGTCLDFRLHANYFLLPWKIPEEIRWSMLFSASSITKKYNVHTTFYHSSGLPEIWLLMEVSSKFHIWTFCVFTLWGRTDNNIHQFITFTYSLYLLWAVILISTKCVLITPRPTYHPLHYMIVGMTEMGTCLDYNK